MAITLALRVMIIGGKISIRCGRILIRQFKVPVSKLSHKTLRLITLETSNVLVKMGVPVSAIRTSYHAGGGATMSHYMLKVKLTPKIAKNVAKNLGVAVRNLSETKKAILASLATSLGATKVFTSSKKKSSKKHTLTRKQSAALKKNGYIYIQRDGKKIKITR